MRTWRSKIGGAEFKVMRLQETISTGYAPTLQSPETIVDFLRPQLVTSLRYNPDVENFICVFLNTRRRPIGWEVISNGTLDTLLIHAREVFKPAILMSAQCIVLAHNHPSGDPTPSEADIRTTKEMVRAGQLLKIEVLDHVILGQPSPERPRGYHSLRELGYFYTS